MKKVLVLLVLLTTVALPAIAAKAQVDYSRDFDFSSLETFQFVEAQGVVTMKAANPLMHERVVKMLEEKLTASGLRKVDSNPDLAITYHAQTKERSTYTTTGYGWGGGYRRWGGGMGTEVTTEQNYTDGTLVVDAWNPETGDLVWRGISTKALKAKPDKRVKQIEDAIDDMADRFRKLRAGERK